MHRTPALIPPRRLSTTVARRLAVALAALLTGLAVLGLAGCGGPGADSPEALFAQVQGHTQRKEWRLFWSLYTPEERKRQTDGWESFKQFLRENPGEDNRTLCERTFGVRPEEFHTLAPLEIFELTMRGEETAMDGARIENVEPAPDVPGGVRVWWLDRHGERHSMLTVQVDGRWRLVSMVE